MDFALNSIPYLYTAMSWMEAIFAALSGIASAAGVPRGPALLQGASHSPVRCSGIQNSYAMARNCKGRCPSGNVANDPIQCEIVQSIVIQEIGAATDKDRVGLQEFLRASGLIDACTKKHREGTAVRGGGLCWGSAECACRKRSLRFPKRSMTGSSICGSSAVHGLGRTGLAEATEPIIESLLVDGLKVPADPVSNALVRCLMDHPMALLPYLRRSQGEPRELLARVASEMATAEMADEMLLFTVPIRDPK